MTLHSRLSAAVIILSFCAPLDAKPLLIDKIKLPPGFAIQAYAEIVPDTRSIATGARGTIFVGSRTAGRVYALIDTRTKTECRR